MGNPVVYFEIGASNDAELRRFYSELFGWNVEAVPQAGYTRVDTRAGSGVNGGIGHSRDGSAWVTFYVEPDDLQAVLDRAESLGGKTVVPVTVIPNVVTWAMFSDPDGLLVGLMKGESDQRPSAGEGAAIDWFEVLGTDAERTRNFYTELFGWKAGSGFPGYSLVDTGAGRGIGGGVGGGSDGRWATVYAHVQNVDQVLARAEQLGGTREYGPNQIEDHMRTAAIRDPAGNVFGIYEHPDH